jgi:hypothetical protein
VPVHDWTRIYAGAFHDFHHEWLSTIKRSLNRGLLQPDYYAMVDQIVGGLGPDVLALHRSEGLFPSVLPPTNGNGSSRPTEAGGGLLITERRPRTRFHVTNESRWYANKGKAVTVRHRSSHQVVAVVEIVSPGNKNSQAGLKAFLRKADEILSAGVHLTVIDVFPPGPRDPEGIHPLLWGEASGVGFQFDPAKPLTLAAYVGGLGTQAFIESVAIGEPLPDVPLFLTTELYVEIPVERTYIEAYEAVTPAVREVLETPPAR